ncbi:hypothetical protein FDECE_11002 [Fusarium decemcellulare]|nr:hypothetical protein FDECE_11002 [Fusarium decemcellulare]
MTAMATSGVTLKETQDGSKQLVQRMDDLHDCLGKEKAEAAGYTEHAWSSLNEIRERIETIKKEQNGMNKIVSHCREVNREIEHMLSNQDQAPPESNTEDKAQISNVAFRAFSHIMAEPALPFSIISQWGSQFDEKLHEGIQSREGPVDEEKEEELQTLKNKEIALKVKLKGEEEKANQLKTIGVANDRFHSWEDYGKRAQRKIADRDNRIQELEEEANQSATNDAEYMKLESELVGVVLKVGVVRGSYGLRAPEPQWVLALQNKHTTQPFTKRLREKEWEVRDICKEVSRVGFQNEELKLTVTRVEEQKAWFEEKRNETHDRIKRQTQSFTNLFAYHQ